MQPRWGNLLRKQNGIGSKSRTRCGGTVSHNVRKRSTRGVMALASGAMLQMGCYTWADERAHRRQEGRLQEGLQTSLKRKQLIAQPGPDAYSRTMERSIRRACLSHHSARAVQASPLRSQRLGKRALCGWLSEALRTRRRMMTPSAFGCVLGAKAQ